jgi:putative ABC transport system permease protein
MPINPQVDLTPNFEILTYTFLTSLLAAAVCGLAPALQATRLDLVSALKEEGFPVSGRLGLSRMRNWLIVAQVAGCTVLLIAAGLLVRGLRRAQSNSPGFFTKNVILISLDLANKGYDETRAAAFQRELHDRLAAVPGVAGVARSVVLPCVTGYTTAVKIPGSKADGGSQVVWANIVSADYFKTMGIGLLRGRIFTTEETRTHGAVPAVVSTAMARRYWPDTDPVGKEFLSSKITFRVLGIAPDVQNVRLGKLDGPFFYAANVPGSALDAKIFVRTFGDPSTVEAAVPQLARKIDANVLASAETFEQALEKVLEPSRTLAWLVATLGILAMVLAVVGVSGIVAYAASQRTHEIGIRKALGAHSRDIVMMLLRQGAKVASIGMAVGLGLAAGVSTMLSAAGLLFGLGALDPLTYLVTAVALVGATLLACYLPAQRATKVDPMVALRYE